MLPQSDQGEDDPISAISKKYPKRIKRIPPEQVIYIDLYFD